MRFTVDRLDHLTIVCTDLERSASWYQVVLGMERGALDDDGTTTLKFGGQKIILRQLDDDHLPRPTHVAPGSAHLCFVTAVGTDDIAAHLEESGVTLERGPHAGQGALAAMMTVLCRDPEGNLVELGSYLDN